MHCQTSLVLSDAVWAETVSPKLVEEIPFDWAWHKKIMKNGENWRRRYVLSVFFRKLFKSVGVGVAEIVSDYC
jgi:hypothetical protein